MSIDNGKEVRVTSSSGAQKGSKDAQLGAVDPTALLELAKVAGYGAKKYATHNYLLGYEYTLSINAASRHLLQFAAGEDLDPETGLCHAAHAAWNCLALVSFYLHGIGVDDRVSAFLAAAKNREENTEPDPDEFNDNKCVGVITDLYVEDPKGSIEFNQDFWYFEDHNDLEIPEFNNWIEDGQQALEYEEIDTDIYQISNPKVFGEFKPVEVEEEKPFKVGDLVDVKEFPYEEYTKNGYISNIDWQANALRVSYPDGNVAWELVEDVRIAEEV